MFRRSDFRKLELFGGGKKNTKVFKVEYIKTGQIFALKEVEAKNLDKLNEYKEEAVQLSKAQHHPNILQCYGYYFYATTHNTYKLGIISEYINRDLNLELIYRKREKQHLFWNENKLLKMTYFLIDTFAYLEHIGICHRDIKPTNLFLMEDYSIKVIDFGESIENFDDDDEEDQMATIRGTPQYLSPILWEAHVILKAKECEHNMFKSDVFSTGLVIFQMASMKDVGGFNQKTNQCDGEQLIRDGLKKLSKTYSPKLCEIIRRMLMFNEEDRPTFEQLGKFICGEEYVPRVDRNILEQMEDIRKKNETNKKIENYMIMANNNNKEKKNNIASSNISSTNTNNTNNFSSNNNNASSVNTNINLNNNNINTNNNNNNKDLFNSYLSKNKSLKSYMHKQTFWFEYGGHIIAKFSFINQSQETNNCLITFPSGPILKWKLLTKYKDPFPMHFNIIYVDDIQSYFLIGGTDGENCYQFKDGVITIKNSMLIQRSFMSVCLINHNIYAIGGYDYNERNQTNSIEVYDVDKNTWKKNVIKDLNIARSQHNNIVINNKYIYVFGGYSKNLGTLNSIEKINIEKNYVELIDLKLPLPIRRFGMLKINDNLMMIIGGISKLSKKNEEVYILDLEKKKFNKINKELSNGGILEHELILDECGDLHLFFENNYGTSPPEHININLMEYINNINN